MTIQTLNLVQFRNHLRAEFAFKTGVNLITGSNGAGKTNVLEAINLLATGKSFRAHYDQEMIFNPAIADSTGGPQPSWSGTRILPPAPANIYGPPTQPHNKVFTRVMGTISNDKDEETLEVIIVKGTPTTNLSQKTFKINGAPKPIHETTGYFATVVFCPQDLDLFNGSPALRRKYLDDLLCKIDQKYKKDHTIYSKALRQRNRLLEKINKTGRGANELPFWTEEVLNKGIYLQEQRTELIQTLNTNIEGIYSDISSQPVKVHIEYKMNQINLERLEKHHEHEIYAKTTLVGPHRDDFDFLLSDFSISHYGSRGQQRTGVLALKMCELNIIGAKNASPPVLLLDDIFSELDDIHKKALERVVQTQQTIITSTHADIKAQSVIAL